MAKSMAASTFRRLQALSGYSNNELAKMLHKSPQSISNYRTGQQAVVAHVAAFMKDLRPKPKVGSEEYFEQVSRRVAASLRKRKGHKYATPVKSR